jgi:hypothetical protein
VKENLRLDHVKIPTDAQDIPHFQRKVTNEAAERVEFMDTLCRALFEIQDAAPSRHLMACEKRKHIFSFFVLD